MKEEEEEVENNEFKHFSTSLACTHFARFYIFRKKNIKINSSSIPNGLCIVLSSSIRTVYTSLTHIYYPERGYEFSSELKTVPQHLHNISNAARFPYILTFLVEHKNLLFLYV